LNASFGFSPAAGDTFVIIKTTGDLLIPRCAFSAPMAIETMETRVDQANGGVRIP
jgi:hypothetical protein